MPARRPDTGKPVQSRTERMLTQGRRLMTVLTAMFTTAAIAIFVQAALSPGPLTPAPMIGVGATGALLVAATAWAARWFMKKALFWLSYEVTLSVSIPTQRGAQSGNGCRPRR